MSEQGERGPTGDHGQDGVDGAVGAVGAIGETGPAGRDGSGSRRNIILIVVLIVALALPFAWAVQRMFKTTDALQGTQAQLQAGQARDTCIADVVQRSIEAQDEAASLAARTSLAAREQSQALLVLLDTSLDPDATQPQRLQAFRDYRAAVGAYVDLSVELAEVRRDHPVPTVEDIGACR